MATDSADRITIPATGPATEPEFEAADSDIRPVVPMRAVPWLIVTYDELQRLPLSGRAGFVVSLIDGRCTVEMLLDVSGMPEDETVGILAELVGMGAIELRDPR